MSSSLPPYVSGLIRGHVDLSVSNLEWTDRRFASPHAVFLVQWWGQKTWSTIVRPNAQKTASFEIRCGMKQFSAYLADMGSLVLKCVKAPGRKSFGVVRISDIASLVHTRNISRRFPVTSIRDETTRLGSVDVNIRLHFDDEISVRTATREPTKSVVSDTEVVPSQPSSDSMAIRQDAGTSQDRDLLSVLMDKGQRLREAMIVSSLKDSRGSGALSSMPPPPPPVAIDAPLVHESVGAVAKEEAGFRVEDVLLEHAERERDLWAESDDDDEVVDALSESDDPLRDDSLLTDLFYQATKKKAENDDQCESELSIEEDAESVPKRIAREKEKMIVVERNRDAVLSASDDDDDDESSFNDESTDYLDRELLTLLGRIDTARIKINRLVFSRDKDRPYQYFVEYHFPVSAVSVEGKSHSESIRIGAKKCQDGGTVLFSHRSAFPVVFHKRVIDKWLGSSLRFLVYSRARGSQKQSALLGEGKLPLRRVLLADNFQFSTSVPILSEDRPSSIAHLEVCLQLTAAKSSRFDEANAVAWENRRTEQAREQRKKRLIPPGKITIASSVASSSSGGRLTTSSTESQGLPLSLLLCISEGRKLRASSTRGNLYVVCRSTIWDDLIQSRVCWGSDENPRFRLRQIYPIVLTSKFVWSLRAGLVIVEMWNKRSNSQDQLVGLLKLSLNHFYATCRDPELMQLFLKAKYPLVGADGWCPIVNPLTGQEAGDLNVLLAIGSYEQVRYLEGQRKEQFEAPSAEEKDSSSPSDETLGGDSHQFSIALESVSNSAVSTSVWGEADCFVQYSFPCESSQHQNKDREGLRLLLRQYRTACLLCLPEVNVKSSFHHAFVVPRGRSIQGDIQTAFVRQQASQQASVVFEMWKRFYVPNIRDQLVAKAFLPLSKLLALVTMHKEGGGPSRQHHVLTLKSVESLKAGANEEVGSLSLSIGYNKRAVDGTEVASGNGKAINIRMGILKATGLKTLAEMASQETEFCYDGGLNVYVSCALFHNEKRKTKIVAKTYSPKFSYFIEFSLMLLLSPDQQQPLDERFITEEQFIHGNITLEVYHRPVTGLISRIPSGLETRSQDIFLGTALVPLISLLTDTEGEGSWFPIFPPHASAETSSRGLAGLSASLAFASPSTRVAVLRRLAGTDVRINDALDRFVAAEISVDETREKLNYQLGVKVKRIQLPLATLPANSKRILVKCRILNKENILVDEFLSKSPESRLDVNSSMTFWKFKDAFSFRRAFESACFELRVFVVSSDNPSRETFIGSANLLPCQILKDGIVSGETPVFRSNVDSLENASIRLLAKLEEGSDAEEYDDDDDGDDDVSVTETSREDSPVPKASDSPPSVEESPIAFGDSHQQKDTFVAVVAVLKALHIDPGLDAAREGLLIRCTASDSHSFCTHVKPFARAVEWNETFRMTLPRVFLTCGRYFLTFDLIHVNANDETECFGSASVELTPISAGLAEICGWYNLADKAGCDRGQLQVRVLAEREEGSCDLMNDRGFGQKAVDALLTGESSSLFDQLRKRMADLDELQKSLLCNQRLVEVEELEEEEEGEANDKRTTCPSPLPHINEESLCSSDLDLFSRSASPVAPELEERGDYESENERPLQLSSPVAVTRSEDDDSVRSSLSPSENEEDGDLTDVSSLVLDSNEESNERERLLEEVENLAEQPPVSANNVEEHFQGLEATEAAVSPREVELPGRGNDRENASASTLSTMSFEEENDSKRQTEEKEQVNASETTASILAQGGQTRATPLFFMSTDQLEENMRRLKSRINDLTTELEKTCLGESSEDPRREHTQRSLLVDARERIKTRAPLTRASLTSTIQNVSRLSEIFHGQTVPN